MNQFRSRRAVFCILIRVYHPWLNSFSIAARARASEPFLCLREQRSFFRKEKRFGSAVEIGLGQSVAAGGFQEQSVISGNGRLVEVAGLELVHDAQRFGILFLQVKREGVGGDIGGIGGLLLIELEIIGFDRGVIVRDIILLVPKGIGAGRQSSSGVEQRTHKPLVGGSNPSSGTTFNMLRTKGTKIMEIIEYKTAVSTDLANLDKTVNELIEKGFQPFGSPYFVPKNVHGVLTDCTVCQAMVSTGESTKTLRADQAKIEVETEEFKRAKEAKKALDQQIAKALS
jgi:hypothetical protein